MFDFVLRRVWRYQRGNQNPYIEEEQTRQWPTFAFCSSVWNRQKGSLSC